MSRIGAISLKQPNYLVPWFLTKELMKQIDGLVPRYYHMRLRLYFNRFGCLRCSKRRVLYGCNGLCLKCLGLVSDRLKRTDRTLWRRYGVPPAVASRNLLARMLSARDFLSDFRPGRGGRQKKKMVSAARRRRFGRISAGRQCL